MKKFFYKKIFFISYRIINLIFFGDIIQIMYLCHDLYINKKFEFFFEIMYQKLKLFKFQQSFNLDEVKIVEVELSKEKEKLIKEDGEKEKLIGDEEKVKPQQSFYEQYKYYILGVVCIVLIIIYKLLNGDNPNSSDINIRLEPEPRLALEPEPEPELQPELRPELRPRLCPETRLALEPEPELQLQPQPQIESEPRLALEPEPELQPELRPRLCPETRLALEPEPELQLQPQPQIEPRQHYFGTSDLDLADWEFSSKKSPPELEPLESDLQLQIDSDSGSYSDLESDSSYHSEYEPESESEYEPESESEYESDL